MGKLQQLHLVKMLNCQKPGLKKKFFAHLHRPPGVIFWWFRNFPHPQRCQEGVQNCHTKKRIPYSEILLNRLLCNFFQKIRFKFSKNCKKYKKNYNTYQILKINPPLPILRYMPFQFLFLNISTKKFFKF